MILFGTTRTTKDNAYLKIIIVKIINSPFTLKFV
jgi:hypothetical protein